MSNPTGVSSKAGTASPFRALVSILVFGVVRPSQSLVCVKCICHCFLFVSFLLAIVLSVPLIYHFFGIFKQLITNLNKLTLIQNTTHLHRHSDNRTTDEKTMVHE